MRNKTTDSPIDAAVNVDAWLHRVAASCQKGRAGEIVRGTMSSYLLLVCVCFDIFNQAGRVVHRRPSFGTLRNLHSEDLFEVRP